MSNQIRTFIAVELSEDVKNQLDKVQDMLRDCAVEIKWVESFNFHLTLKFLGKIKEEQLVEIKAVLSEIASNRDSFEIEISEIGAFPSLDYPRVIWSGIDKGEQKLIELQSELESELLNLDFAPEDRQYTPHITLGRLKDEAREKVLSEQLKEYPISYTLDDEVSAITLFKSELTEKGPKYTVIDKYWF